MFEMIVGLALLPMAIVVGAWLLALSLAGLWMLGGWILALIGLVLVFTVPGIGGFICLVLGLMWGGYSASWALEK